MSTLVLPGLGVTDWIILAVLLLCVLNAARRGIFVEAFSLAGFLVGLGAASWYYGRIEPWFLGWLPSPALAGTAAFLLIALAVALAAGLLGRLLRGLVRTVGLGWADRLLGAAFGLLKGGVVVTLGVAVLLAFWPGSDALAGSRFGPYFAAAARGSALASPERWRDKVRFGTRLLRERVTEQAGSSWLR